ncbi:MAG TPA: DUF5694 domain-containing protein [Chitinophagaceae bacterium]|nr:DUF5694 domain-containing protein [Chitinophagaceae bacterium]
MKTFFTAGLMILILTCAGQGKYDYLSEKVRKTVDSLMWSGPKQPAQALLLGTWHFAYHDLDAHKTKVSDRVDVLAPQRQKELDEVIAVLKRYKPTRIYVESVNQQYVDSLYGSYLQGKHTLRRNELDQIAMRLGKELGLDKLYAADDGSFMYQYYKRIPLLDSLRNASRSVVDGEYWNDRYMRMYDYSDSLLKHQTILEHLLMYADPYVLKRNHGHYIIGGFQTEGDEGPDGLSMWWYSRNLRIFNNIMRTRPAANDRILVLFGNGHMSILRHLFEASPEFKLVELMDVVNRR